MESWPLVAGMHQNVETAAYQPKVNLADVLDTKHLCHLELAPLTFLGKV